MSLLFILCIIILLFCTVRGYRKGLFGIVFGIISWIFIAVCLIYGTPKMNNILMENSRIYDKVYSGVENYVSKRVDEAGIPDVSIDALNIIGGESSGVISQDKINEKIQESMPLLPPNIAGLLQNMSEEDNNDMNSVQTEVQNGINEQVTTLKEAIVQKITKTVTDYVIRVMAFTFTLIIAFIIVLIVSVIIKIIELNRGVKTASNWLGLLFGLAEGLIFVYIILYVISALSILNNTQSLVNDINNNVFLSFLYNHNPITNFFAKN